MSGLDRFKRAQERGHSGFESALSEIESGGKSGHWMWYILPQLDGLGSSFEAHTYAIEGRAEAIAYLQDSALAGRYLTITDGHGFRVLLSGRADLTATFGCIEDCPCDAEESIVALPANEFFDDACIFDHRSALGAFVGTHFGDRIDAFKRTVSERVRVLRQTLVEREVGEFQESYGVGTSLFIKVPGVPEKRVILSAVTRKRAGEGIKAEPTYVFASVQAISRIMNDERLTDLHVPLLGSGHGDMDHDLALLCLALALANTPDIRHANIVIFRRTPEATPILAPEIVRKILSFVARDARG